MSRSKICEAVVLAVHDIGEADRLCILFTREYGRLAARACGVRKLTSRMGGSVLPQQHIDLQLHKGKAGWLITGVQAKQRSCNNTDMRAFLRMQQWTELLLVLLHDEEPLPEVFDLTLAVLFNKHAALPAVVQLLGMLGMISAEHSVLDEEERQFINHCIEKEEVDPSMLSIIATKRLRALCRTIIEEHGGRMLRSPEVAVECNA